MGEPLAPTLATKLLEPAVTSRKDENGITEPSAENTLRNGRCSNWDSAGYNEPDEREAIRGAAGEVGRLADHRGHAAGQDGHVDRRCVGDERAESKLLRRLRVEIQLEEEPAPANLRPGRKK